MAADMGSPVYYNHAVNWLVAHQQEIVIGIVSSAIVAVTGYLLSRLFSDKKQPAGGPVQTAQGGKIADSPVTTATGSNITQNVNSPTTVQVNVGQTPQQTRPALKVEIREVCFDDVMDSLKQDWSGFTLERYIFVRIWVVNTESVATNVKEWKLVYSKEGTPHVTKEIADFSKWRQHVKWSE